MLNNIGSHLSYGFSVLEEFLYPEEGKVNVNIKIRDLFTKLGPGLLLNTAVLIPCGTPISKNAYNSLDWFFWNQSWCNECSAPHRGIAVNYAMVGVIGALKESLLEKDLKIRDVWERVKEQIEDPVSFHPMRVPLLRIPCGHSLCNRTYVEHEFARFRDTCSLCDIKTTIVFNRSLEKVLKVIGRELLEEEVSMEGFSDLSSLIQETAVEIPDAVIRLRDIGISFKDLAKLNEQCQRFVLENPDNVLRLKSAGIDVTDSLMLGLFVNGFFELELLAQEKALTNPALVIKLGDARISLKDVSKLFQECQVLALENSDSLIRLKVANIDISDIDILDMYISVDETGDLPGEDYKKEEPKAQKLILENPDKIIQIFERKRQFKREFATLRNQQNP